jgi:hypothetical protein
VAGLAKLEYQPKAEFMRLFVAACMASRFEGFVPQALSNVINGEHMCTMMRESTVGRIELPRVAGLAKLEYRPEAEFMRLFVEVCTATGFEGFDPQALSNVINGKYLRLRLRPVLETVCRSDVAPVRGRPGEAEVSA